MSSDHAQTLRDLATSETDYGRKDALYAAAEAFEALSEQAGKIQAILDISAEFEIGCAVIKASGPQWDGKVVGYYSSSFTDHGLVIECTAPGAIGQVHVEPSKRMIRK